MLLISVFMCVNAYAQKVEIKGKVIEASSGEAVIGATIIIQGTTIGAVSDHEGSYFISAAEGSKLICSYLGYKTEERVVGKESTINFALTEDAALVEEIVIIGYGGQKRSSLSTSISKLDIGEDIKSRPTGLFNALQGQIPGVTITGNGGDPLSNTNIVIRGQGSRGGDPILFIVDGVPGAPYNDEDVETITVLKDAASAAIYGANVGSGGVVLVTTKKAKEGKTIISAKAQMGFQSVWRRPEVLTAEEYNMVRGDAARVNGSSIPAGCDPNVYPYGNTTRTDWIDEVFRTGKMQNYAFSISGGSEKLRSLASVEYSRVDGTMLNTYYSKLGGNVNVDFQPYKWLTISERVSFRHTNGQGGLNNSSHTGVLASSMFYPRSATVYEQDQQGNYVTDQNGNRIFGGTVPLWAKDMGVAGTYGEVQNPVATLMRLNQYRPSNQLFSTTSLQIKPISDLSIKSDFTANLDANRYEDFNCKVPEIGKPNLKNSRTISNDLNNGFLWETVATYERYLGNHHISIMGGASMKYNQWRSNSTTMYGFEKEDNLSQDFINGTDWTETKPSEGFAEEASTGLFARVSYSYDDRYFFSGSVRRDASSKLYNENNSGVFPSGSLAWKLSSEKFMKNQNVISLLKVRGSWGRIGNVSAVNNYSYVSALASTGSYVYLGQNADNPRKGVGLATIPNLNLKWETSEQTDLGIDIGLLQNRLNLTADYYIKNTRDLIEQLPVPSVAGLLRAPYGNIGLVRNSGWEFMASYSDRTKSNFGYSVSGNFSILKNEVKNLGERDFFAHDNTLRAMQPLRSTVGESWYSYYLIKTDGIFQTKEEIENYTYTDKNGKTKLIQPNAQPGDLRFVDYDNDGIIGDGDKQFMGSYMPKVTYGLIASFDYKGVDLSFQIQGVAGNKIFNGVKVMTYAPGQGWNMSKDVLDSWAYNKNSDIPLLSMSDLNGNTSTVSDFFLENGDYARLKNVTLGYTLPSKLFGKQSNTRLRVYFSGENLLTITKYSGMDPEVGNWGLDGGTYPTSRIFSFGVNINF